MIQELNKNYVSSVIDLQIKAEKQVYQQAGLDFDKRSIKNYLLDTLKRGKLFGYFEGNKLIASGGVAFDEGVGEIRHIFTLPEFQRKGIGKKMMEHIENYAKSKAKKFRLYVLITNPAVSFYEKLHFKKRAYVMEKDAK